MEGVAEEFGAKAEAIVFLDHFRELPDPRQRGKVLYPLDEILLCVCSRFSRERKPLSTSRCSVK